MSQKKKEEKRKPKYKLFSCVNYICRLLWQYKRSLVFVGIFTVPISLILAAIGLYTPPLILSVLQTSDRFSYIALVIVGLLLAQCLFELINTVLRICIDYAEHSVVLTMVHLFYNKIRGFDFYLIFDPEVQKISCRAEQVVSNNHSAGAHFPMDFANVVSQLLNFLLFGSVISLLHPVIIVLLTIGCLLNFYCNRWEQTKNWNDRDVRNSLDKKIGYCTFGFSRSFQYAKDVRLYTMQESMQNRLNDLLGKREKEQKKLELRNILTALEQFLFVLIRDGAAYAFLIYKAGQGEVDASSFVLYFSAITSMSNLLSGIFGTVTRVQEGALQISDFREAMELEGRLNRGEGIPTPTKPFSIEFKDVSYQYPTGEKKVLDHVSFRIEAGENIALVGLNGAGKTTLTMLACGMLLPDEGEVLLDGHPLTDYNRDEMYALFGFVPQNYNLLPLSIAKNIACTENDDEIDFDKLRRCIDTAGLSEKIASLPNGVHTPLNREVNQDGITLSGGETQKLLLARLLYKNPPCIILDEPTAALDPIAEDQMYRKYHAIAEHATSVYISHRLASTRFCDRIFLLDGARFAEVGTHDSLMQLGGKYRELFDVQSKYYREESKEGGSAHA